MGGDSMSRRAEYPEWVMKYLTKGVYVNKVGDKYYLYKAHTEKVPGAAQPRRINDGYLGRVTEKEGFVPARKKEYTATTLDYAIPFAVDSCCQTIHTGLRRSYKTNGSVAYVCSVLSFLYGVFTPELYEGSWLSLQYPGLKIPRTPTDTLLKAIDRGTRMIQDSVLKVYGDDWQLIRASFAPVVLIRIDGRLFLPSLSTQCTAFAIKYHLKLDSVLETSN